MLRSPELRACRKESEAFVFSGLGAGGTQFRRLDSYYQYYFVWGGVPVL